jgi:hypothetical protein
VKSRFRVALVALLATATALLTAGAASPSHVVVPPHSLLSGAMKCSGDVPSPGAWVNAGFGRIRVCWRLGTFDVEGDIQDTRTDTYCVDARFNRAFTADGSFHKFPHTPPQLFGSAVSCGSIQHFYTQVDDDLNTYDSLWKIRIYRSTAFVLALDTHTARTVQR